MMSCRRPNRFSKEFPRLLRYIGLSGVTIWGEKDSLLLRRDRFIKINKVAKTPKLALKRDSKVIEIHRHVWVIIWGEMDGLLLCRDCFVKISNVAQTPKLTFKEVSKIIEVHRLVRVTVRNEMD